MLQKGQRSLPKQYEERKLLAIFIGQISVVGKKKTQTNYLLRQLSSLLGGLLLFRGWLPFLQEWVKVWLGITLIFTESKFLWEAAVLLGFYEAQSKEMPWQGSLQGPSLFRGPHITIIGKNNVRSLSHNKKCCPLRNYWVMPIKLYRYIVSNRVTSYTLSNNCLKPSSWPHRAGKLRN